MDIHEILPSRELTYPPKNGILKMIFLFPRWDILVPWRVVYIYIYIKLMIWGYHYFWKPPYGYPWDIRDIKYFSLEKRAANIGQAIEAPGPRVAYAEGLARAVLCEAGIWCDGLLQVSQATEFVNIPKVVFFPNVEKIAGETFRCKVKICLHHHLFIWILVPWLSTSLEG